MSQYFFNYNKDDDKDKSKDISLEDEVINSQPIEELSKSKSSFGKSKNKIIFYVIVIIAIIGYAIFSASKNVNFEKVIDDIKEEDVSNTTEETLSTEMFNLIDKPTNNYNYEILINITENNIEKVYTFYGTRLSEKYLIMKKVDNVLEKYYQDLNIYYKVVDNNYIQVTAEQIYPINYSYLTIDLINSYIEKSNLVLESINYKEQSMLYNYETSVSDVLLDQVSNNDVFAIFEKYSSDSYQLSIDYTNVVKHSNNSISNCLVTITYTEIGKITTLEDN
ncbi:MAG: hypothetical protein Q4G04_04375 [bacterium]|nr:hypothetical protein [bacterium]